jgi:hypothetical protein
MARLNCYRFLPLILLLSLTPLVKAQPRSAIILDHRDRIRLTPLSQVNSPARETNLSITPDGNTLYFMSLRGGQQWSQSYMTFRGDSVFDGDIWYSTKTASGWQKPKCMPFGINSANGEDEPVIAPTGKTVYFQSWNYLWEWNGGPYYKAQRSGDTWSKPIGLGGGITEFFKSIRATDGMTIGPDEKTFIVAAGVDYDTNMDLYISRYTTTGWSYCRRLAISTAGDERSVFLAADGKTLYFASDGYNGYGGLDIFKTTLNPDGSFGEVINLGKPFNTEKDDYGFIITGEGNSAYFIRSGDIYYADLKEADERMKPTVASPTITLKGTVRDSATLTAIPAKVLIFDNRSQRIIKALDCPASGKFELQIPNTNSAYDLVVSAPGYHTNRRTVAVSTQSRAFVTTVNVLLGKPKPDKPAIAQNPPPKKPDPVPTPAPRVVEPITQVPVKPPVTSQPAPPVVTPPRAPLRDPYSFEGVARNNLVLVIDVSASMRKPEKLPLLKNALIKLLGHMRSEDRITVVAFSGEVSVVVENMPATNKEAITRAIDNVNSSGSTNGQAAVKRAYKLAQDHFIPGGNNRIILATDGAFDLAQLQNIINKNQKQDIRMTIFAFGKLPEAKIQQLTQVAKDAGGNFASVNEDNLDTALLKEAQAVRKN